ncbi:MAG TPA: flagellar hook capping FlgD N-terminal domain-containing protein [Candidatus Paceibacterota bacterium]|nr:flagellar hook capping FlgD N-terminal domain-containing protein [Candidatus Paceibacterota bacterium]
MSTVSSVSGSGTTTDTTATSVLPEKTLSQNDFFKLLIAQMSAQDPMNPMSNAEFIGQMAQFSTLEQSKTMMSGITQLQANSLIGQNVDVKSDGGVISGTVSGVLIKNGTPNILVNGTPYALDQVITIAPPTQN